MLKIDREQYAEIQRHAEEFYPKECCGVVLGTLSDSDKIVLATARCSNADGNADWFSIDPRELMRIERDARKSGHDILGFYHSHNDCPAQWSKSDLEEAHWMGCSYVISGVNAGKATEMNSFLLAGTGEEDKHFENEVIEVVALQTK